MLPATAAEMIALLGQPGMESAWRSERRPDSSFHNGFAAHGGDGYDFMAKLPPSWQPVPDWGDWPYLIGWRNDRDCAVMTYCERDLSVEVARDRDGYLRLLRRTTNDLSRSRGDADAFVRRLDSAHASSNGRANVSSDAEKACA